MKIAVLTKAKPLWNIPNREVIKCHRCGHLFYADLYNQRGVINDTY